MEFEYIGYGNLGKIRIGLKKEELLNILGEENVLTFKKGEDDVSLTDYFEDYGLFVYYDKDYVSEGFEFDENAKVLMNGKNLVDEKIRDVIDLVLSMDKNLVKDFTGFTSLKLGIAGYHGEGMENLDVPFESIMFFREGYYNEIDL